MRMNLHASRRDDALGRLSVRSAMSVTAKQPSKAMFATAASSTPHCGSLPWSPKVVLRRPMGKWLTLRILVRILLPLVHLLLELLCFFFIRETQPKTTFFSLKGVEECPVLEILESVVDLLVPNDASAGLADIDELDPERIAHEVVGEDRRTL